MRGMDVDRLDSVAKISARLRKLKLEDLWLVREAAKLGADAWLAISNQPRAGGPGTPGYDAIIGEVERCDAIVDLVAGEATRRRPSDFEETEAQAKILIDRAVLGGAWKEAADLAMTAALRNEAHMAEVGAKQRAA